MTADSLPLRLLLATLAGWVNRHQQQVIDYLMEENRAPREQLRGRRVRLSDGQRRRLAAKGQRLGRRVLRQVATIVTPDTILRWYRRLIAQDEKHIFSNTYGYIRWITGDYIYGQTERMPWIAS